MKEKKVVIELTRLEMDQLWGCILNGYGDGDMEELCSSRVEVAARRRANYKVKKAGGYVYGPCHS